MSDLEKSINAVFSEVDAFTSGSANATEQMEDNSKSTAEQNVRGTVESPRDISKRAIEETKNKDELSFKRPRFEALTEEAQRK